MAFLLYGLISVAAFTFLGVRLVQVFRRDGRTPELMVGVSFLFSGIGVAGGMMAIAPDSSTVIVRVGSAMGGIGLALSAAAVLRFISLVFHADQPKAQTAAHSGLFFAVLIAAFAAARAADGDLVQLRSFDATTVIPHLFLAATLGWLAWSALQHWVQLTRRAVIGLAEPVMVNRMLLYGVGSVLSSLMILVMALPVVLFGTDPMDNALLAVLGAPLGLPIGPIYYLALVPPVAYQRWILRRSGSSG